MDGAREPGRGRVRPAHLRMDRETFCFQGLSLRMPMPKPERKKSSPVVTRSHFCEASNSSTAESQMKACSLLRAGAGSRGPRLHVALAPREPSSCQLGTHRLSPPRGSHTAGTLSVDVDAPSRSSPPPHLSRTAWMASAALS